MCSPSEFVSLGEHQYPQCFPSLYLRGFHVMYTKKQKCLNNFQMYGYEFDLILHSHLKNKDVFPKHTCTTLTKKKYLIIHLIIQILISLLWEKITDWFLSHVNFWFYWKFCWKILWQPFLWLKNYIVCFIN